MKKIVLFVLFFPVFYDVSAQSSKFFGYPGQMILQNNEVLTGDILYYPTEKVVYVQYLDSTYTYFPKMIKEFYYVKKGQRTTYVVYNFPNSINRFVPTIFELIWEVDEVKMLKRRVTLTKIKSITRETAGSRLLRSPTEGIGMSQFDAKTKTTKMKVPNSALYIYFVDEDEKVKAYLKKGKGGVRKILDRYLLPKLTKSHYKTLKQYALDRKLEFDREKDLMKIMNYYKTLISKA